VQWPWQEAQLVLPSTHTSKAKQSWSEAQFGRQAQVVPSARQAFAVPEAQAPGEPHAPPSQRSARAAMPQRMTLAGTAPIGDAEARARGGSTLTASRRDMAFFACPDGVAYPCRGVGANLSLAAPSTGRRPGRLASAYGALVSAMRRATISRERAAASPILQGVETRDAHSRATAT
jgi:cell wall-associated NlpC family hydrolase